MTRNTTERRKLNSFKLSDQVKAILQDKGLSKIFDYSDYEYFKRQIKSAFNKAQAIADLFIQENSEIPSDYNDYIY